MDISDATLPWDDPIWFSDEGDNITSDSKPKQITLTTKSKNTTLNQNFDKSEKDQEQYIREFKQFTINNTRKNKSTYSPNNNLQHKGYTERNLKHTYLDCKQNYIKPTLDSCKERNDYSNDNYRNKNVRNGSFEQGTNKSNRNHKLNDSRHIKVSVKVGEESINNERNVYINYTEVEKEDNPQLSYYNIELKSKAKDLSTIESQWEKNVSNNVHIERNQDNYENPTMPINIHKDKQLRESEKEYRNTSRYINEGKHAYSKDRMDRNINYNNNDSFKRNIPAKFKENKTYSGTNSGIHVQTMKEIQVEYTIDKAEEINEAPLLKGHKLPVKTYKDNKSRDSVLNNENTNIMLNSNQNTEMEIKFQNNLSAEKCNKTNQNVVSSSMENTVRFDNDEMNNSPLSNQYSHSKRPPIEIYNSANVRGKWSSLITEDSQAKTRKYYNSTKKQRNHSKDVPEYEEVKSHYNDKNTDFRKMPNNERIFDSRKVSEASSNQERNYRDVQDTDKSNVDHHQYDSKTYKQQSFSRYSNK